MVPFLSNDIPCKKCKYKVFNLWIFYSVSLLQAPCQNIFSIYFLHLFLTFRKRSLFGPIASLLCFLLFYFSFIFYHSRFQIFATTHGRRISPPRSGFIVFNLGNIPDLLIKREVINFLDTQCQPNSSAFSIALFISYIFENFFASFSYYSGKIMEEDSGLSGEAYNCSSPSSTSGQYCAWISFQLRIRWSSTMTRKRSHTVSFCPTSSIPNCVIVNSSPIGKTMRGLLSTNYSYYHLQPLDCMVLSG